MKVALDKTIGPSTNLLERGQFKKMVSDTNKRVLLGHTRSATFGEVSYANAHPFAFNQIVGAHNGTLYTSAVRELPYNNYFGTDSEALLSAINDHGVEEIIPKMEGAWALSWVNLKDKTLNFLRNDDRPLCFCFNEKGDVVYWASEGLFLRFILTRKGIKIKDDKVWMFNKDNHYTFKLPNWNGKFEEPTKKLVEGKRYKQHVQERWFRGSSKDTKNDKPADIRSIVSRAALQSSVDTPVLKSIPADLKPFNDQFYSRHGKKRNQVILFNFINGVKIGEKPFEDETRCGCAWCNHKPKWGENVQFIEKGKFLCQECSTDEGVLEGMKYDSPGLTVERARDDGPNYLQ